MINICSKRETEGRIGHKMPSVSHFEVVVVMQQTSPSRVSCESGVVPQWCSEVPMRRVHTHLVVLKWGT